jgi:lysyl-tRNA synthetase class II
MKVTEQMISGMVYSIHGTYKIRYKPSDEYPERLVDFTPPFKRINLIEGLEQAGNFKMPEDLAAESTNQFLRGIVEKFNVNCPEPKTTTRLLDKLVGHFLEGPFAHTHSRLLASSSSPFFLFSFFLFLFSLFIVVAVIHKTHVLNDSAVHS